MTKAVIWGRMSDPKTRDIQRKCKSIGVETEVKDLLKEEVMTEFRAMLPEEKLVPQVYVDGTKIGNVSAFMKWWDPQQAPSKGVDKRTK